MCASTMGDAAMIIADKGGLKVPGWGTTPATSESSQGTSAPSPGRSADSAAPTRKVSAGSPAEPVQSLSIPTPLPSRQNPGGTGLNIPG